MWAARTCLYPPTRRRRPSDRSGRRRQQQTWRRARGRYQAQAPGRRQIDGFEAADGERDGIGAQGLTQYPQRLADAARLHQDDVGWRNAQPDEPRTIELAEIARSRRRPAPKDGAAIRAPATRRKALIAAQRQSQGEPYRCRPVPIACRLDLVHGIRGQASARQDGIEPAHTQRPACPRLRARSGGRLEGDVLYFMTGVQGGGLLSGIGAHPGRESGALRACWGNGPIRRMGRRHLGVGQPRRGAAPFDLVDPAPEIFDQNATRFCVPCGIQLPAGLLRDHGRRGKIKAGRPLPIGRHETDLRREKDAGFAHGKHRSSTFVLFMF